MNKHFWIRITQISYFLLMALLLLWTLVLYPTEQIPSWQVAAILLAPLALAAPGIIKAKLYTFAWAQFVNMLYFCHGVMYLMTSEQVFWIALLEVILVLTFFTAAILAIRSKDSLTQAAAHD